MPRKSQKFAKQRVSVVVPGRPEPVSRPSAGPGQIRCMSSPSFQLADLAYAKIIFHALKHPHHTVNGVLLGAPAASGRTVDIFDAVPLQHHWANLSPMMEAGLGMVRSVFLWLSHLMCINGADHVSWKRSPTTPVLANFISLVTTKRLNVSATLRCLLLANAWQAK
jgi:hypothetical protein